MPRTRRCERERASRIRPHPGSDRDIRTNWSFTAAEAKQDAWRSGASGRPALPPTMGGPTEAGQGGPRSLLVQVFYRQKWRHFGPATLEARKNLAPNRPAFPPCRPRMGTRNWV